MQIEITTDLTQEQRDAWDLLQKKSLTAHPEQDLRFEPVHRADGKDVAFAMGHEAGVLVAVALLVLTPHGIRHGHYSDAMAYSGPVCDDLGLMNSFLAAMLNAPFLRWVGRLRVTPYWLGPKAERMSQALAQAGWQVFEHEPVRHTGQIDLSGGPKAIYDGMSKGARVEFRKAERQGLEIEFVSDIAETDEILDLMNRHREARRMGPLPAKRLAAEIEHIFATRDLGALILLRHQGTIVAGLAAYRSQHTVHPSYYFTDPERLRGLQNLRVAPFLWYQMLIWAAEKGSNIADVEGFRANSSEDDKLYRVHRYKADLGAVEVLRVAGHACLPNPLLHVTGNFGEISRRSARRALDLVPQTSGRGKPVAGSS